MRKLYVILMILCCTSYNVYAFEEQYISSQYNDFEENYTEVVTDDRLPYFYDETPELVEIPAYDEIVPSRVDSDKTGAESILDVYGIAANMIQKATQLPYARCRAIAEGKVEVAESAPVTYAAVVYADWNEYVVNTDAAELSSSSFGEYYKAYNGVEPSDIISYAMTLLGVPYMYGGNSPEQGFDCSGFVKYVYAEYGVQLDRVAADQVDNGVDVDTQNLQPGDLLFFGSNGYVDHVAIYIGGDKYIHSPRPGGVVEISEMYDGYFDRKFMSATRVLL